MNSDKLQPDILCVAHHHAEELDSNGAQERGADDGRDQPASLGRES
ncbi:MAG: hypothetical protein Q7S35_13155 [Candidatus Limnocylindrales bacterium]|nr:hypothetical protein [Candidatus Limnocylindrales bacterium]